MEYLIGTALGVFVLILARVTRFDTDRSFYPVILIVIAFYYVLFAVMIEEADVIFYELLASVVFSSVAIISGMRNLVYVVAAGLILHGVYDLTHNLIFINPGTPSWWQGFCAAFDFVLGVDCLYLNANYNRSMSMPID
ncbi:MAG: hypothetical protein OEY52_07790 [Gammaproteobacteria bacterium]|nr:hypothetical protein [Gammaproteobacteria bacterium]